MKGIKPKIEVGREIGSVKLHKMITGNDIIRPRYELVMLDSSRRTVEITLNRQNVWIMNSTYLRGVTLDELNDLRKMFAYIVKNHGLTEEVIEPEVVEKEIPEDIEVIPEPEPEVIEPEVVEEPVIEEPVIEEVIEEPVDVEVEEVETVDEVIEVEEPEE